MERYHVLYGALLCFFVYGFLGWCIEVAFAAVKQRKFVNRGFLNGPICPIYGIGVVSVVVILEPLMDNTALLYLGAVVLVTALEWITGFLLEKLFHHKWWDYSNMPMNLNGYVCVLFSFIWGIACMIIVKYIHPLIYHVLMLLPIWAGVLLLTILMLLMIADLYVTVTGILKMNRRMKKMEIIAEELHNMSDHIGSTISKNALDSLDKTIDAKQKMEELKQKYKELLEGQSRVERRMLGAFPKMKPNRSEKQFEELKEFLQKKKKHK